MRNYCFCVFVRIPRRDVVCYGKHVLTLGQLVQMPSIVAHFVDFRPHLSLRGEWESEKMAIFLVTENECTTLYLAVWCGRINGTVGRKCGLGILIEVEDGLLHRLLRVALTKDPHEVLLTDVDLEMDFTEPRSLGLPMRLLILKEGPRKVFLLPFNSVKLRLIGDFGRQIGCIFVCLYYQEGSDEGKSPYKRKNRKRKEK